MRISVPSCSIVSCAFGVVITFPNRTSFLSTSFLLKYCVVWASTLLNLSHSESFIPCIPCSTFSRKYVFGNCAKRRNMCSCVSSQSVAIAFNASTTSVGMICWKNPGLLMPTTSTCPVPMLTRHPMGRAPNRVLASSSTTQLGLLRPTPPSMKGCALPISIRLKKVGAADVARAASQILHSGCVSQDS